MWQISLPYVLAERAHKINPNLYQSRRCLLDARIRRQANPPLEKGRERTWTGRILHS